MIKKIKAWCFYSETIFWSRLQTVLGAAAVALTYVDPTLLEPVLGGQYFPWFLFANGIATEYLRRRRDPEM